MNADALTDRRGERQGQPGALTTAPRADRVCGFCCALVVAGLVIGHGAWLMAEGAKPVRLQLQWRPQAQFAGYIVAEEKGFYREAGLPDVRLLWWTEGDSPLKLVVDGKADFCTGWVAQALVFRHQGEGDVVNIAQIMQKSALMLVARRSSGIVRPEDMSGRRLGLWAGGFDVQPLALCRKFDVRPIIVRQSYSVVPFLRGAVDVASAMYYNEYHKFIEAGLRREDLQTFHFADYGMNFPEDGLYCTAATRRDRAATCHALVAASLKGWDYAFRNEVETLDRVMRHCEEAKLATNRNHQRWMLRAMAELIQHRVGSAPARWGTLARDEYENVATLLREQGLIKDPPRHEEFHAPAFGGGEGPP